MSFGNPYLDDGLLTDGVMSRRCVAWAFDFVLIAMLVWVLWWILAMFGVLTLGLGFGAMGILPFVPFAYHLLSLLGSASATPGQQMMGLTVRRDYDFGPPTALQALISVGVFYLTLATSGLLLLVALFTVRHRTLHDLLSGLVVVPNQGVDHRGRRLEHGQWSVRPMTLYKPPRRPQFFYTTAPLPCPYLAGRTERKVVTEIVGPDAEALHDRLSRAGFRRSHNIAYAPVCPACQACVPIRIPVETFQPDRTLRKIAKANAGLEGYRVPARATAEQFQLFQRYQQVRHGDGDMASMSFYDYRAMVEDTPIETFIIEFRNEQDRLVSACLGDKLGDGLSAVYSFFMPGLEKQSLGTYAVLWLIERARSLKLPYVYLGYWVPESRKMAYKARFKPSEVLVNGTWRMLTDSEIAGGSTAEVTMVTESAN